MLQLCNLHKQHALPMLEAILTAMLQEHDFPNTRHMHCHCRLELMLLTAHSLSPDARVAVISVILQALLMPSPSSARGGQADPPQNPSPGATPEDTPEDTPGEATEDTPAAGPQPPLRTLQHKLELLNCAFKTLLLQALQYLLLQATQAPTSSLIHDVDAILKVHDCFNNIWLIICISADLVAFCTAAQTLVVCPLCSELCAHVGVACSFLLFDDHAGMYEVAFSMA